MWRRTLLTSAVLLLAPTVRAQAPAYQLPGNAGSPTFPARGPGMTGFNGPTVTPINPAGPMPPGMGSVPMVRPSAPYTAAPVGANPGLATPTAAPTTGAALETTVAFDPDQAEMRWQDN